MYLKIKSIKIKLFNMFKFFFNYFIFFFLKKINDGFYLFILVFNQIFFKCNIKKQIWANNHKLCRTLPPIVLTKSGKTRKFAKNHMVIILGKFIDNFKAMRPDDRWGRVNANKRKKEEKIVKVFIKFLVLIVLLDQNG